MGTYDAFLSHNSFDKPIVEEIASTLESVGIHPFLDKWHILPGDPWQEVLEGAIEKCRTCVVCISASELGPWQNEEMRVFLEKRVKSNDVRVIPLLLPGVTSDFVDTLPVFLRRLHFVDFRQGLASIEAYRSLIAGITGQPERDVVLPYERTSAKDQKGLCVVLSGPSSVGKDVVLGRLINRAREEGMFPELLTKYTTRERREAEDDADPFIYLAVEEFKTCVSERKIGCVRYSYGNYYGIDQTFSVDIRFGEFLFASQRLYEEIDMFKHAAVENGYKVVAILLVADYETLRPRIQQRSLSAEQKTKRAAQVLEDTDFLSTDLSTLSRKFDLVIDNSDRARLSETVSRIWDRMMIELDAE